MILDDILPSYLFLMLIIPGSIHIGVHFLFLFLDDLFLFFVLEGNEYGFGEVSY